MHCQAPVIAEDMKKSLVKIYLILKISEPERSMNNDEHNRQHDSHQEHQDTAALVDEEVPSTEGGQHHQGGVLLLDSLHLGLLG